MSIAQRASEEEAAEEMVEEEAAVDDVELDNRRPTVSVCKERSSTGKSLSLRLSIV
jgi:hypothetical protein